MAWRPEIWSTQWESNSLVIVKNYTTKLFTNISLHLTPSLMYRTPNENRTVLKNNFESKVEFFGCDHYYLHNVVAAFPSPVEPVIICVT